MTNEHGDRIPLNRMGSTENCDEWTVPEESYVKTVALRYNLLGVTHIKFSTEQSVNFERG